MRIHYKRFVFTKSFNREEVTVITDKDYERRSYQPTEATYNRFADLANSGKFHSQILERSEGFGWEIMRFHHEPPAKPAAPFWAKDHVDLDTAIVQRPSQVQIEKDGDILWAV